MDDRRVAWQDAGFAALLVFFAVMGTGPAAANQGQTAPALSYALAVAAGLSIAIWRWRPMWTFVLSGVATVLYLGLGYAYGPILVTLAVATYGLAVRSPIRQAVSRAAVLLVASAVAAGVVADERAWEGVVSVAAWIAIPAAVGVAVKVRRDAGAAVRAEQGRRAVSEERLRLAQEVHDVVGHGLAVVAMQAGVALRLLDQDPAKARSALEAIRGTSREALDGLRAEVEALRSAPPEVSHVPLRPGVGLADLPRLTERLRAAGLTVAVDIDDQAGDLPAEVDRAAYRIVQESLSNVLRHGGPEAAARVAITRASGAVRVEVADDGGAARDGPAPPGAGGQGIDGMRARATALGGTLDAAPRPHGGFAVRALLPIGTGQPAAGDPE